MPSIKIPRKSTDTDMTPFVDIAFLILSFFIMATKFKPDEPVEVVTPDSVSSKILEENNSFLITISKDSKIYVNISDKQDQGRIRTVISRLNSTRNLGLSEAEIDKAVKLPVFGMPLSAMKQVVNLPASQQVAAQPGIPVLDTLNNELTTWVAETSAAFGGSKLNFVIKGDNDAKYPVFEAVINAMRKNELFKYNLITSQAGVPAGSELARQRAEE